jgi:hypothetical protein
MAAAPEVEEKTKQLIAKGRWMVPGYQVRSITQLIPWAQITNFLYRRNLATFLSCRQPTCILSFVFCISVNSGLREEEEAMKMFLEVKTMLFRDI